MPAVELRIVMNEAGDVQVSGPIENKLVCYGLLELARETIALHAAQVQQRRVQLATALPLGVPQGS